MAVIARQNRSGSGGTVTMRAAAAGDTVAFSPGDVLLVNNASAAAITVTVNSQATASPGFAPANLGITVGAGAIGYFGLGSEVFRNASGEVVLAYSATAGVTVGVLGR